MSQTRWKDYLEGAGLVAIVASLIFARQWFSDKVLHRPVEIAAESGH